MNKQKVRVRFAPSPTGALHIGGVRTALYNYLFAKQNGGNFILRIEDTDQTRFVEGAEEYIKKSLDWIGITPDEGPEQGGDYGPYRQSDRKSLYKKYADQLVEKGHAYYAFDSPDDLTQLREEYEKERKISFKYDATVRYQLKNSLNLSPEEVSTLIEQEVPYVVRMFIPEDDEVIFSDLIRDDVRFDTNELDDKVILKADGMPTYHLANIVDDYLMEISHVIRGEEWLSSTGHHVLLYKMLGWTERMPQFAHLPLLLKPEGGGKLSKRDGAKFGFPVFPLQWEEPSDGNTYKGFREAGILPEALANFIALLGWSPGNDQEIFSVEDLVKVFSLEQISKSGARFDYDKALWFNQQYIIHSDTQSLLSYIEDYFPNISGLASKEYLSKVLELYKERIHTILEFPDQALPFFSEEFEYDTKQIKKRYKPENHELYLDLFETINNTDPFEQRSIKSNVESFISEKETKFGVVLPILRLAIAGILQGPDLFAMMEVIGKEKTRKRLDRSLPIFQELKN
ncbi:glutamate--tRNA ligase [Membranihabitans maritimus]|uniref:glutamate--tRNA ligase n=1 Tax=Membranihabitans maritimus TaxID=2904244 RepID=UPI001F01D5D9|nr:glutamate--tRNA ligase [Membranihabitans maritimus]